MNDYEVGKNKPPKEHQFSSTNQPMNNGRPKGRKSLATIVRELEDEEFNWDTVPFKSKELELKEQFKKLGSPWKAIVIVALRQAGKGDHQAREWLRKSGYGDKLDLTTLGKELPQPILGGISAIHSDDGNDQDQPA